MHLQYQTLELLVAELRPQWIHLTLEACFTQDKDELVLLLSNGDGLRFKCSPKIQYWIPILDYHRKKLNSTDLFPDILPQKIQDITITHNDRTITFTLSRGELIFKLYGSRSNILWVENNSIKDTFRRKLSEESWWKEWRTGKTSQIEFPLLNTPKPQIENSVYSIAFGKLPTFFIGQTPTPWPETLTYTSIAEGLREWLKLYLKYENLSENYLFLKSHLDKKIKYQENRLLSLQKTLTQTQLQRDPAEIGHLILANVHKISAEAEKLICEDLYQGGQIEIPLKKELSAGDNAVKWYEKSKRRELVLIHTPKEILELENSITVTKLGILNYPTWPPILDTWKHWQLEYSELIPEISLKKNDNSLFRNFTIDGWNILVGKDAKNNDLLTQRYCQKNDLWLHVKDYSGSHVVIKNKAGKDIPQEVKTSAAQLAIWFSPRRNQTLVPVMISEKKHIRKSKRMAPGEVGVSRYELFISDSPEKSWVESVYS
jgi:predicted ribosome quality control (RQC) complex YloA/Tae2 family protein